MGFNEGNNPFNNLDVFAEAKKPEKVQKQEEKVSEAEIGINKLRLNFFEKITPDETKFLSKALGENFDFNKFQQLSTDLAERQLLSGRIEQLLYEIYGQDKELGQKYEEIFSDLNQKFIKFYEEQGKLAESDDKNLEKAGRQELLDLKFKTVGKIHDDAQEKFQQNIEENLGGLDLKRELEKDPELSEEKILDLIKIKLNDEKVILSAEEYLELGQAEFQKLSDDELYDLVEDQYQDLENNQQLLKELEVKGYDLERIKSFSREQKENLARKEMQSMGQEEIIEKGKEIEGELSSEEKEAIVKQRKEQLSRDELIELGKEQEFKKIEDKAQETYEKFETENDKIITQEYQDFKDELETLAKEKNIKISEGEINLSADRFFAWLKEDGPSWQSLIKEADKGELGEVFQMSFKKFLKENKGKIALGILTVLVYSGLSGLTSAGETSPAQAFNGDNLSLAAGDSLAHDAVRAQNILQEREIRKLDFSEPKTPTTQLERPVSAEEQKVLNITANYIENYNNPKEFSGTSFERYKQTMAKQLFEFCDKHPELLNNNQVLEIIDKNKTQLRKDKNVSQEYKLSVENKILDAKMEIWKNSIDPSEGRPLQDMGRIEQVRAITDLVDFVDLPDERAKEHKATINKVLEDAEKISQDEVGKLAVNNMLNLLEKKILNDIPLGEISRLERIKEAKEVYEKIEIIQGNKQLEAKVGKWLEKYKDKVKDKAVAVVASPGDSPLNYAEPVFNKTEADILSSEIAGDLDKLYVGDVIGLPSEHAYELLGDLAYKHIKESEKDNIWKDKKKWATWRKRTNEQLKRVEDEFKSKDWVTLENGYRLKTETLNWFLDLKMEMAKKGYYIGITSTDEGNHVSLEHFTGDAVDFKVYKIGKILAEGKEVIILKHITKEESKGIFETLTKSGMVNAKKTYNEYEKPAGHATGRHIHVTKP